MNEFGIIHWNASPEILSFGVLTIRWYGLLFALSFISGYQILSYIFTNEKKSIKDLDSLTIYVVIGTIIGARLGHCLFYEANYYLSNPVEILKVWEGGLASHGGAIGILTALWIFTKRKHIKFAWILDRLVIVVALAGFFIRIGNFFNSEIYGIPTNLPWGVVFELRDAIPRHPTQIYEALAYLVSFVILFLIYKKQKGDLKEGLLAGLFFILVFTSRFLLEFLKEVQSSFESGLVLDMGQLLSIPFIVVGVVLTLRSFSLKN